MRIISKYYEALKWWIVDFTDDIAFWLVIALMSIIFCLLIYSGIIYGLTYL